MPLFDVVVTEGNNDIPTRKLPSRNSPFNYRGYIDTLDDFVGGPPG